MFVSRSFAGLHRLKRLNSTLRSGVHSLDRLYCVLSAWAKRRSAEHVAVTGVRMLLVAAQAALVIERWPACVFVSHGVGPSILLLHLRKQVQ